MVYCSLRDDVQAISPASMELTDSGFRAKLGRTKTTGPGKKTKEEVDIFVERTTGISGLDGIGCQPGSKSRASINNHVTFWFWRPTTTGPGRLQKEWTRRGSLSTSDMCSRDWGHQSWKVKDSAGELSAAFHDDGRGASTRDIALEIL